MSISIINTSVHPIISGRFAGAFKARVTIVEHNRKLYSETLPIPFIYASHAREAARQLAEELAAINGGALARVN